MSGGSYQYLYTRTLSELFGDLREPLRDMSKRLDELFLKSQAANDTGWLLKRIEVTGMSLEPCRLKLENVWHAVECYDSYDNGLDEIEREIRKYELS